MKACENSFDFIMAEELIEIPFFQRGYVWDKEQWAQLLNDLNDSYENKREHFLGSVVLKQLNSNAGEGSRRSLIDGQQRLTTFSILVKSLYDFLESNHKQDYTAYLYKRPSADKQPKISHERLDKDSFNKILSANSQEDLDATDSNKLIKCYKFFSKELQNLKDKKSFLDFILHSRLWVIINLDSNEDEQKIFDSINTAGLKLTASDIIKNAIFAKAISLNTDYERLYKTYWEAIFETGDNKDFWEQEVINGNVKRVQSEIFLHAFAVIQKFFNTDKDTIENLSTLYKNKIKDFNAKDLEDFLSIMKEFALLYKNLPRITNDTALSFENGKNRLFHILKVSDTNTIMPLILALQYNLQKDNETLESCFKFLENYIFARYICGKPTDGYNKLFANLTQNLPKDKPLEYLQDKIANLADYSKIPTKDEIIKSLKNIPNRKARLVLFWIELYRRYVNRGYDIIELSPNYTLEHLCPVTWETCWSDIIENEQIAKEYINQIGNMTLLKSSLNSQIRNSSWDIKINGDGSKKNCIKKCADLSITREILDTKVWNLDSITNRTDNLTKEFFKIWNVG